MADKKKPSKNKFVYKSDDALELRDSNGKLIKLDEGDDKGKKKEKGDKDKKAMIANVVTRFFLRED